MVQSLLNSMPQISLLVCAGLVALVMFYNVMRDGQASDNIEESCEASRSPSRDGLLPSAHRKTELLSPSAGESAESLSHRQSDGKSKNNNAHRWKVYSLVMLVCLGVFYVYYDRTQPVGLCQHQLKHKLNHCDMPAVLNSTHLFPKRHPAYLAPKESELCEELLPGDLPTIPVDQKTIKMHLGPHITDAQESLFLNGATEMAQLIGKEVKLVDQRSGADVAVDFKDAKHFLERGKRFNKSPKAVGYQDSCDETTRDSVIALHEGLKDSDVLPAFQHEFGHFLGMNEHSEHRDDLMFWSTGTPGMSKREEKRLKGIYELVDGPWAELQKWIFGG